MTIIFVQCDKATKTEIVFGANYYVDHNYVLSVSEATTEAYHSDPTSKL